MSSRLLALGLCTVNLMCARALYAQRHWTSFGRLTDLQLSYVPSGLTLGSPDRGQTTQIAVSSAHSPGLHFYTLRGDGSWTEAATAPTSRPLGSLVFQNVDDDPQGEYIALSQDGTSIVVLHRLKSGWREQTLELDLPAQRLALTDLNRDRRPDILLFGRGCTGVRILLGGRGGEFVPGPTLVPEISMSAVKVADLNGDGISDVVMLDWLARQLTLSFGIGRMVFAPQVSVELAGEPDDLAIWVVRRTQKFTVAVTLTDERSVVVFEGNALGEIRQTQQIPCPATPWGAKLDTVDGDGFPDLVVPTAAGTMVALGMSEAGFWPPAVFGAAKAVAGWGCGDIDGDGKIDMVIADSAGRRLIVVSNSGGIGSDGWKSDYAVGSSPRGVLVTDLNGDGRGDLVVANTGSSSLSVLLNKGSGSFEGQQAIPLESPPLGVAAATAPAGQRVLLASHPLADKVSVILVQASLSEATSFALPTCSRPEVIRAETRGSKGSLEIFVTCASYDDASRSLSILEQLEGSRFLERTVSLNLPYSISALTVDRLTPQGGNQLILATRDNQTLKMTISASPLSGEQKLQTPKPLFSFHDSSKSVLGLLTAHLDGDEHKDILIACGPPRNAFLLAYSRGDGTWKDSLSWISGVSPAGLESIIVKDVDGNRLPDVTYIDQHSKAVMTVLGRVSGRWSSPAKIFSAESIESIYIAPLKNPENQDLVVALGNAGVVKVLFDPFRK